MAVLAETIREHDGMAFTFLWARRARRCARAASLVDVEAITDLGIKSSTGPDHGVNVGEVYLSNLEGA
jgi:hypothetical protein